MRQSSAGHCSVKTKKKCHFGPQLSPFMLLICQFSFNGDRGQKIAFLLLLKYSFVF